MKNLSRTAGAVLIAALVGSGVVGCNSAKSGWDGPDVAAAGAQATGGSDVSAGSASESSASESSAQPSDSGSSSSADSGGGGSSGTSADLPSGFPIPDGAKVQSVGQTDGADRYLITLKSNDGAYDFWLKELAGAGYTIESKFEQGTTSQIVFSGNGFSEGKLSIVGGLAALSLTK